MKTIKPLGKIVLLEVVNISETESGLVIPDQYKKEEVFRVKTVGSEVKKVKGGEIIIVLGKVIMPQMHDLPDNLRMIHEDGIIGVVVDQKKGILK